MPLLRTGRALALTVASTAGALAGCESEARKNTVLAGELDKICHAVDRSGATSEPEPANRMAMVAIWLDQNIRSEEGLTFLRAFARLGEDKAARLKMLEEAAQANGVRDCPLVAFWR